MADAGGFQPTPGANPTDPNEVAKYVQYLSQQPGADPTLATDPGYWSQKIIENGGGLTPDNIGYWNNRSKAGAGDAGGGAGRAGGGGGYGGVGGFSFDPNQLEGNPGYQFALKEGQNAVRGADAAKGIGLSTGAMKDLQDRAVGVAYQGEGQLFGQGLQGFQANFNDLGSISGAGQNAAAGQGSYIAQGANAAAGGSAAQGNIWGNAVAQGTDALNNGLIYQQMRNGAGAPKTFDANPYTTVTPYDGSTP